MIFNASYPKGLVSLNRLCVDVSYLREHRFKNSLLDTLNPICVCGFDIKTFFQFFL